MRIADMVMAVVLAALSLAIMWKSGEAPWGAERFSNVGISDTGAPAGGFWPFWLAAAMFVCCIWVLVNAVMKKSPVAKMEEGYLDRHGLIVLLTVGFPVFLLVLLTEFISMYFAMAVFMFYYMFFLGRHGIILSVAMTVVLPFWMFLFFDITMTKTLPKGLPSVEDGIFVPLGNWFRQADGYVVPLAFLLGGVILVGASWLSARRSATNE